MIKITDKKDCCGCNACGDVCAHRAITFKTDIEGFWYPEVDMDKCTNCGLCEKVCPIINVKDLKKNDLPQSICYAAEHKNLEVVFDSTSGGLFSALADIMYKDKGFVGGAVFNEDFSVKHYISNVKEDLSKLRSSKYLQSCLIGFFKQVRDLVKEGKNVLVCGCPCQMAALRAFLRYKDYPNLIIADFICRGINSPKVWRKYLDSYEERYGSPVVYVKSKSKELGWRNLTQKTVLANGKTYFETKDQNLFTKGYLQTNAYCRPACYDCKFKGYPRISDITLADFWGVEKIKGIEEKNLGTSLVMVNSEKGKQFFERVKSKIKCVQVAFKEATERNPALTTPCPAPSVDRTQFFEDIDKMSFTQVCQKYNISFNESSTIINKIKKHVKLALRIRRTTKLNPKAIYQFIKYNSFKDFIDGNVLIPTPYCIIDIAKDAHIIKKGVSVLGNKMVFPKSHLETRLLVGKNATLELGPETNIGYGSDVEVFANAHLIFKGHGGSNIGLTCICGNYIEFGDGVMMGRNVTVRDNNGNHYINRQGYKNSAPVIIGDKAWLCESCTIMNGVKVGAGAIIGAKSFVITNVPANSMASGHPAKIIDKDVLWKY